MANVLFVSPHQDDETLSMGMAIKNHLAAGHNVFVMLVTDGSGSSARYIINNLDESVSPPQPCWCGIHGRYHNPVGEGYTVGSYMDAVEMSNARYEEQQRAVNALGVTNAIIRVGIKDDTCNVNKTTIFNAIKDWIYAYGGPSATMVRVTSYTDTSPDHQACAQVVQYLKASGHIADPIFYISPEHFPSGVPSSITVSGVTAYQEGSSAYQTTVVNAQSAYKLWLPTNGKYGVGYHSVQNLFDKVDPYKSGNMYSYYHA